MFLHFWQKFENSKWPPFLGRGIFFFENWRLGDRHIYVICYVAITQEVKAIAINNNTKQAIDPTKPSHQILQR